MVKGCGVEGWLGGRGGGEGYGWEEGEENGEREHGVGGFEGVLMGGVDVGRVCAGIG